MATEMRIHVTFRGRQWNCHIGDTLIVLAPFANQALTNDNSADVGESMVVCGKRKVPQEGENISKLRCEETKGRARVWWAFFCEHTYRQLCKLDAAPNKHALRKAAAARR